MPLTHGLNYRSTTAALETAVAKNFFCSVVLGGLRYENLLGFLINLITEEQTGKQKLIEILINVNAQQRFTWPAKHTFSIHSLIQYSHLMRV